MTDTEQKRADQCGWVYDDSDYKWDTECGEAYCFTHDGPGENGYRFCPGCGKRVSIQSTEPDKS